MRVRDIMTTTVVTATIATSFQELVDLMIRAGDLMTAPARTRHHQSERRPADRTDHPGRVFGAPVPQLAGS